MRVLWITAVILFGLLAWLRGAERGYSDGYGAAMADVYLGITTAEKYINSLNKPVRTRESN